MGTVVFDFDSTLIQDESLEILVADRLASDPELAEAYRATTRAGMEGGLPFGESLRRRLAVAAPNAEAVTRFLDRLPELWTPGVPELASRLQERGHHVWIVSGGFRAVLVPAARALGVPERRVLGVAARWNLEGRFEGLVEGDPFARSKVEGVRALAPPWGAPRVGVGDGMTDYALHAAGLVDAFVAFTANVRREALVNTGAPEAASTAELADLLDELLGHTHDLQSDAHGAGPALP